MDETVRPAVHDIRLPWCIGLESWREVRWPKLRGRNKHARRDERRNLSKLTAPTLVLSNYIVRVTGEVFTLPLPRVSSFQVESENAHVQDPYFPVQRHIDLRFALDKICYMPRGETDRQSQQTPRRIRDASLERRRPCLVLDRPLSRPLVLVIDVAQISFVALSYPRPTDGADLLQNRQRSMANTCPPTFSPPFIVRPPEVVTYNVLSCFGEPLPNCADVGCVISSPSGSPVMFLPLP